MLITTNDKDAKIAIYDPFDMLTFFLNFMMVQS